jgi:hypothetical protein
MYDVCGTVHAEWVLVLSVCQGCDLHYGCIARELQVSSVN